MPITKQECTAFFQKVCAFHALSNINFEIYICDDKESRILNNKHLQCNSPTNVLSFNEDSNIIDDFFNSSELDKNELQSFLGSLALSIDTCNREAFLYKQEKADYAKSLLLHGFAHLLGYDHGEEMDFFCNEVNHLLQ